MFWQLAEIQESIVLFLDRGGPVLYLIMVAIALLWMLGIERFIYLRNVYRGDLGRAIGKWEARNERTSWYAHQIRQSLLAELKDQLNRNMNLIKTLVALCPLFGLLGTVTGMIEVFDVMAFMGQGSPRAMASGISKATIPTMAGMVGALTGLLVMNLLERSIEKESTTAEDKLTFDH